MAGGAIVLVVVVQGLGLWCGAEMAQEHGGGAGVLAQDQVGGAQGLGRAGRDVAEVADRGGDQRQAWC